MKTRKKPCIRSGLFWSCLADVTIPRFIFNFLVSSYFDFLPPVQNCFLGRVEGEGAGSVPLYSSVEDSRHFLARIRIRKSVPLTYGSVPLTYGSGSYCFRQAANKNRVFFFEVFLLITFWKYIYISLQRKKKAKRSYKGRNQGFLLVLMEGSGSGYVQIMTDPRQKHSDPDPQHCLTDVVSITVKCQRHFLVQDWPQGRGQDREQDLHLYTGISLIVQIFLGLVIVQFCSICKEK